MPKQRKSEHKGSGGFGTYLAMFLVLACTMAFIAQHWLGLNVTVSNTSLDINFRDSSLTRVERTERPVQVESDPTAIRRVVE